MNKILSDLKDLLSFSLNNQYNKQLSPEQSTFFEELDLECRLIETNIHHMFLGFEGNKAECNGLIYYLQRELSLLSNRLAQEISPYGFLNFVPDHLIDFLRHDFASYLNQNEAIPDSYRKSKMTSGIKVTHKLRSWLGDNSEYEGLIEIIDDYLQQNGYLIETYEQMNYYLQFVDKLEGLIDKKSLRPVQARLIEHLYYFNFNVHAFITYCSDIFTKHAEEKESLSSLEMEEYLYLKKLGLRTQHEKLAYDHCDKTLRIVIKELTSFELEYQKELLENKFRVETYKPPVVANMTVTVLMVLAEAAKAAKAFTTTSNNHLYNFVADNFTTINHEGRLSVGAMKNRKNEADQRSAMEALRHLENIQEAIRKKYM